MSSAYGKENYKEGEGLIKLIDELWKDEMKLKSIYKKAQEDCQQFLKDIGVIKVPKKKTK